MRAYCILLLLLGAAICTGQHRYQFGLMPSVNVNKKLPADWKINFKTESRQELEQGVFGEPSRIAYQYLQTDFSLIAAKKIGFNKSVNLGYMLRVRENTLVHRSIQQFILVKNYTGLKLAHRIATDQTFEPDEAMEFRLRYRLASNIPTNGLSVDPREFYVKINHEYLNEWQADDYNLEIRLVPHLGYMLSDHHKIEIGVDYRLDDFLESNARSRCWLVLNWYRSL